MTYLSKTWASTNKMVAGLAHKKFFKKQHISKKRLYKQTEKTNKQTYLPNTA